MKITDFVLAEDIRFEIGNKCSIIGVFGESITMTVPQSTKWPIALRLATFVRLELTETDPLRFHFVFHIGWENEEVVRLEGEGSRGAQDHIVTLPLNSTVPLRGPGVLSFALDLTDRGQALFSERLRPMRIDVVSAPSVVSMNL